MAEGKNTIWGFVVIAAAIGSLCFGYLARNKAEMGNLASKKPLGMGLLATTDKYAETTESEYFYELAELLKQHYVEPVEIDQKMASGAIRGMVTSLIDPESNFYDPDQFTAFQASLNGKYEGIGVELDYRYIPAELEKLQSGSSQTDSLLLLPKIVIASVMPGGPAEKAGLQAGDEVREVQGKYIVTGADIKELRDLQTAVTDKKATTEQLNTLRNDIQKRVENVISAPKVRNHLLSGTNGEIQLVVFRNGKEMPFNLIREVTKIDPVTPSTDGSTALRFFKDAPQLLEKTEIKDGMTIDLRNSGNGDYATMEKCLEKFIPAGTHGAIINAQGKSIRSIITKNGPTSAVKVTLLVDESTTGAAATFANILRAEGTATIKGDIPEEKSWVEIQTLPDGSGYTLAIGKYKAEVADKDAVAAIEKSSELEQK